MLLGNDISKWQGEINWEVYKNNTNFCILKASEGTGYTDPKFYSYQTAASVNNIPLGYYHFARPDLGNSAEAEADWFIKVIGEIREGELLCLDFEPQWNGNPVVWSKNFLDRVASRLNGYKCPIYLNQSQITSWDWSPVANAGYGLWVAAYTYDPTINTFPTGAWPFACMQQWTNKQIVPGISGGVDGDVFFGDLVAFKKYGYHKPIVTPPTPPPTPPTPLPEPTPICPKYAEAKAILFGKGFWWVKLAKLKELFKNV